VPTYQYACTECGERLEAVQSFSDAALTQCPDCQGKLRKVFNSVGIVFKGSGFYRNDSRPANGTAEKSNDDAAAKSESKTAESSSSSSDGGSTKTPAVATSSTTSSSGSSANGSGSSAGSSTSGAKAAATSS
jgi:putative FmdB family regulatory protein